MIPLRLTLQGLYSYKEAQVIDFEALAGSPLFGIFGAVGSGKSSILEAIVFVLYDRSERLNRSGDNRYYNMLNLQSEQFAIDFEFRVTNPQPTRYRFTVAARRKKKHYEKVEIKERRQYRWENDAWLPIEVADAAPVIGMTYENFMQTVIIPQGKFREFIDQKPNDRTQMLKELFRLEKFDLSHKTVHLLTAVRHTITGLEARLSEVGSVSAEDVDATRRKMNETEVSLRENTAALTEAEAACRDYEHWRKLFADRAAAQQQYQSLLTERPHYQAREEQLRRYQEAETYFREKFNALATTEEEQNQAEARYQHVGVRIKTGQQKLAEAQWRCEQAQQHYAERDTIRARCADWEHMLRISRARGDLERWAADEAAARTALEDQQKASTLLKQQIKETEVRWAKVVSVSEQQGTLQAVVQWHTQRRAYEAERETQQQEEVAQHQCLTQVEAQKEQIVKPTSWPTSEPFTVIFDRLATASVSLRKNLREVIVKLADLRVRRELADAAQRLTSGEACPLCGATHHPSVASATELTQEIERQEGVLAQLQAQEAEYAALEKKLRTLHSSEQSIRGKLSGIRQLRDANEAHLVAHLAAFSWEAYRNHPPEALVTQLKECTAQLSQSRRLQQLRNDQMTQLEEQEKDIIEEQQRWQHHQQQWLNTKNTVDNYRSLLRVLSFNDYAHLAEAQILREQEDCRRQLQEVEQGYETARQQYQEYEKALVLLKEKKRSEETTLNTLRQRVAATQEEIHQLCCLKKFDSASSVKELLNRAIDTQEEQRAVLAYRNRLHAAEEEYQKLVRSTQDKHYSATRHQEAQDQLTQLRHTREQLQQTWAVTQQAIKDQQARLLKVQQLNQSLREQRDRESNLKELVSLFRGSGFVNYASTVLLQEVCRGANVRFKKLTKNNLSLELNKDNDFVVRDYLNGGKTRLLKTLSGGQTFQAALCLALALAENIRSLNQSQQSFFFLDEGFGSLDKDALRVVFDTLKTLRQENRIVGIISHVEELQQEIDVYLRIEHHRERGSLVKNSWDVT